MSCSVPFPYSGYDQSFSDVFGSHRTESLSQCYPENFLLSLNTFCANVPFPLELLILRFQRVQTHCTKIKFSMKDFFSKCDPIRWKLQIWSHLLKKYFMENFIVLRSEWKKWIKNNLFMSINAFRKVVIAFWGRHWKILWKVSCLNVLVTIPLTA